MQFVVILDQRSPNRLVVMTLGATAFMSSASARARGVSRASSSPILKPTALVSVRMACPGSYRPALIVMTHPSVRCRPASAATRSSLMPFWKSTMTPSPGFRKRMLNSVAQSVALDGVDVGRPLIDQRHVVVRQGEQAADD